MRDVQVFDVGCQLLHLAAELLELQLQGAQLLLLTHLGVALRLAPGEDRARRRRRLLNNKALIFTRGGVRF